MGRLHWCRASWRERIGSKTNEWMNKTTGKMKEKSNRERHEKSNLSCGTVLMKSDTPEMWTPPSHATTKVCMCFIWSQRAEFVSHHTHPSRSLVQIITNEYLCRNVFLWTWLCACVCVCMCAHLLPQNKSTYNCRNVLLQVCKLMRACIFIA